MAVESVLQLGSLAATTRTQLYNLQPYCMHSFTITQAITIDRVKLQLTWNGPSNILTQPRIEVMILQSQLNYPTAFPANTTALARTYGIALNTIATKTSLDTATSSNVAEIPFRDSNFNVKQTTLQPGSYTILMHFQNISDASMILRIFSDGTASGSGKTITTDSFLASSSYSLTTTVPYVLFLNEPVTNTAPTDITLSSSSIYENAGVNAVVGNLSTTDTEGGTMTYAFVAGSGDTHNSLFNINSNQLRANNSFNYESMPAGAVGKNLSVRLRVTDPLGLTYDKVFTISVTNVNESPTDISLSASSIAENLPSGTTVGTLSATDPDASSSFTYSLSGTDASSFSVVGNVLKTAAEFNYESKSSYSINVTASDGSLTYTKAFTISVTNVNEAPTNVTLSSLSIMENQPSGTTVGTLSTTDPDAGNTFTYTVGGTDAGFFNIVGNSLKTAAVFDYEMKNSYSISVTAQDQGGLNYTKAFTISVLNDTSDDTVQLSSSNSVDLSSGITFAAVAVDPRTIPVLKNGNALPTDSVVRNTVTGQKFLKVAGSATAFMAIEVVPPVEWGWDQSAIDAWAILQSL